MNPVVKLKYLTARYSVLYQLLLLGYENPVVDFSITPLERAKPNAKFTTGIRAVGVQRARGQPSHKKTNYEGQRVTLAKTLARAHPAW